MNLIMNQEYLSFSQKVFEIFSRKKISAPKKK